MKALLLLFVVLIIQECSKTAEKTGFTGVTYTIDNPAKLGLIHIAKAKVDTIYGRVIGSVNEVLVGDSLTYEIVYDNKTVSKYLKVGKHTGFITVLNARGFNELQPAVYPFKVKVSLNEDSFYGVMQISKHSE